jgi:hypothetical protein
MSTFSTRARNAGLADYAGVAVETASEAKRSLLQRIRGYFRAQHRARVDSEVARLIRAHGGVMSDELEREISRKLGSMAG